VISRFKFLVLPAVVGLACRGAVEPSATVALPPPPPPPPNRAPIAVAGGPYTSADGTVRFDGSASSDSDGDPLTFRWAFGDGATSDAVKPSHTYAQDGSYTVTLGVTDNKGAASTPAGTMALVSRPVVFVGAGNIATCGTSNDEATAQLLDSIPGTVFTAGDNAFPNGSDSNYVACYGPSWGRHKARTYAVLGNHDYQNLGDKGDARPSFDYFGDRLGPRGLGYYSYDLGAWHIIVLNDKGAYVGLDPASPQAQWLAADLAQNTRRCTLALWHIPLFLSSNSAGYTVNPEHKAIWDVLYAAGVDVVINGQQHHYERMAPMNPDGAVDQARGMRQFNVGTGGGDGVMLPTVAVHPNSEKRAAVFGVLKLTLKLDSYDWEFVPVAGATFSDTGSGTCH